MVPKKSQFSPRVPNFAFVELFLGRSQIPNPVLERLLNKGDSYFDENENFYIFNAPKLFSLVHRFQNCFCFRPRTVWVHFFYFNDKIKFS